ncbi:MCE family protein, partial [Actinomadura adrarensis]
SEAAIRWRNPIGQRMVYLIPGTSTTPLKDGARITRTRSVVDLGELINQLAPLTRALDPQQINQLMASVYQALEGNEGNVGQLVANIDHLSSTIASRRNTLQQALRDFAAVSEVLGRRDRQIKQMTDNLVTLSNAYVDNRKLLDQAMAHLAAMMRTTDGVLAGNAEELEEVVRRLSTVMGGTNRNLDRVDSLLKGTAPKMSRLFDLVNEGQYFVGAAPCLTLATGPCPYRTRVAEYPSGGSETGSVRDTLPTLPAPPGEGGGN